MQENVKSNHNGKYAIDYQGLSLGEHLFFWEVEDALFSDFESEEVFGGRGRIEVRLIRHASMMDLFVTIGAKVEVACDRCLEHFWTDVLFEGELVVKISDVQGEYDGDVMWVSPQEDRVDLKQYFYESIVLSLPFQRVHEDISLCNQDMIGRFSIVSEGEFEELVAAPQHNHDLGAQLEAQLGAQLGELSALSEKEKGEDIGLK